MTPDASAWERAGRLHTLESRRDSRVFAANDVSNFCHISSDSLLPFVGRGWPQAG